MDELYWDVRSSLENLVSRLTELQVGEHLVLSCHSLLAKQNWTSTDREQLLQTLAKYLLYPQCTLLIAEVTRPVLLDLLERAGQTVTTRGHFCLEEHERLCLAVGKVLKMHPDAFRFLMKYLQTAPPVFERLLRGETATPKEKKKKRKKADQPPAVSLTDILATCHRFLDYSRDAFTNMWDWSLVMDLVKHEDLNNRWFSLHIVAAVTNMADHQTRLLLSNHFTPDELQQLTMRHEETSCNKESSHGSGIIPTPSVTSDLANQDRGASARRAVIGADLSPAVVAVHGVLLPVHLSCYKQSPSHPLVQVPSTARNLHSLALAVSSGTAVLLEGSVGCGKTALVEHLAKVTGHGKMPHLLKVQLGDQTDSKALVGTYRCTDIPGEFVWQPGALTQAVTGGHWTLLEDIDYAPMDVVSVLIPLLEAGSLSLPGHGDVVRAAPGFQLFATQRLTAGVGGYFKQHVSHAALLDRMWSKVNVEQLSREELKKVVMTLHPRLTPVVDKLLDIFCMLSSSEHKPDQSEGAGIPTDQHSRAVNPTQLTSRQGRLISTRDLLKWCSRISTKCDAPQMNLAIDVYLEALDCFCAALHKPKMRSTVAEAIGVRLNLSLEKCRFYGNSYKPNIDIQQGSVTMGRARLGRDGDDMPKKTRSRKSTFAFTRPASILLERVAVCITNNEPVLLVGETGTGKTSSVQYLADLTGQRLKVINMNQQSDSTDLLGGYKPVDFKQLMTPFREEFEELFIKTFSRKQNTKFLIHLQDCFTAQRWKDLLKLISHCLQAATKRFENESRDEDDDNSTGKQSPPTLRSQWRPIGEKLQLLKAQLQHAENALAFSFVEGTLVQAVRNGDWVLLDEINLATAETLECLSGLLESTEGTVTLLERGDSEPIIRHKDFRLFACMNPATDVGKKELPPGIRNRFTEFYVDELEETQDLKILVSSYLRGLSLPPEKLDGIVQFYLAVRKEAEMKLTDGTGHKPHYSLRTLCRALRYASSNPCGSVMRSLYESFCLSFLTQLDRVSHPLVEQLVCKKLIGRASIKSVLGHPIPPPTAGVYVKVEGYWIAAGNKETEKQKGYIMTPSVRANLRDLARIVSAGSFPVLLQGETSVGKTSLIQYLAMATGNHCVRVNNHEHTDLQEYVGFYAADEMGKLVFKEGVLVDAMRKGHWIILDELNLAPSDVLEALNRLLDDNRELYIPETQEMVSAHPRFMLFATQNPPGQYGGRKVLSRAFRNRFVELHFDEIPSKELETILHQRCAIPLSYCKRMVAVMLDLQTRRKGSGVFSGKQGFITLRDLFRWAERYRRASQGQGTLYDWDQHIADDGYLLLAGRVRRPEEQTLIKEVLEKHIRCQVDPSRLFDLTPETSPVTKDILQRVLSSQNPDGFQHVVWTLGMRRMAVLVGQALKFQEPVLLVGETGCGKTTVCQLYAALSNQKLYSVNCHLHTETSDFLGGLRPVRQHSTEKDSDKQKLFEWCDGPLVLAMREDAAFLIDEISLADDSVLERLNSVLEPERTLLLAERGSGENRGDDIDMIVADKQFFVVSTMNPGGDFGKKELSPALRNRFTEIWCPQSNDSQDLVRIIEHNLVEGVWLCNQEDGSSGVGNAIMEFVKWFQTNEAGKRWTVSIRDILSWVHFINTCCDAPVSELQQQQSSAGESLDTVLAYVHGACMVFLDGLGSGNTSNTLLPPHQARRLALDFLRDQIWRLVGHDIDLNSLIVTSEGVKAEGMRSKVIGSRDDMFGIEPFFIPRGPLSSILMQDHYALNAPTTALNAQRVLRALQLPRAILLEGSPGVGKTSLVSAIAKASGHELVRINLSEQTDVTDLFGADLPVEGGEGGQFAWRDGPLLTALKGGHWIVLDELNLASQSVLEGLNACLDHRAEVYVPELGKTFHIQHDKTRLFACQNPLKQGGGRKGLPRSFLNRFTQVYIEPLTPSDLLFITRTMYPMLSEDILDKMVTFNKQLYHETMVEYRWGQRGGPWEFNLRDLFRWCDLMVHDQQQGAWQPGQHVGLIYRDRMRSQADKQKVQELFQEVCGGNFGEAYQGSRQVHITPVSLQVGHSFLKRNDHTPTGGRSHKIPLQLLHHNLDPLESLMKCIQMNWMCILVGPSASGKTSLVHLLGHMTGHRVRVLATNSAMDTTELLGGFEQADLNRHWEKALQSLRWVVMATERLLLLAVKESASHHAQQLLAGWAALNKMCQTGAENSKSTPSCNEGLSERKLDMFEQVLDQVRGFVEEHGLEMELDEKVSHVTSAAAELRTRLEKEGRTIQQGGGGKFEWVDGLLVQALKDGDWLLIDNVNFCSPSVLDRLNALLEPNGVLTINERGVIDGHIPTIEPHPDFRIVLAMDPRHGEISRAMRNRGVEVYIVGEREGGDYDRLDLLTLLSGIGLEESQASRLLLELHDDIQASMPGCDVANLPSILLATSLTVQLVDQGRDVKSALNQACTDVYIRGQLSKVNRQKAQEIVGKHLETLETGSSELLLTNDELSLDTEAGECAPLEGALTPHGLPSVDELSSNASWAMMKREAAVLKCILNEAKNPRNVGQLDSLNSLIKPAVLLFLEQATPTDWQLRGDWLLSIWKEWLHSNRMMTSVIDRKGVELVKFMLDISLTALRAVFQHPLHQRLSEILDRIEFNEERVMLQHYSLILGLAPQLIHRLDKLSQNETDERMLTEEGTDSSCSLLKKAVAVGRRLFLILLISVSNDVQYTKLKHAVDLKHKPTMAIQLSYALHQGVLGIDDLPHPLLAHIYPFFSSLDKFIGDLLSAENGNLSADAANEILLALQWRDRCWQVCDRPIKGRDSFHLGQFALHWGWLMKKTVAVLPCLLLGGECNLPQKLQAIIGRISDHIATSTSTLSVFEHQRALQHHMGQPLPYKTSLSAELSQQLCKLSQVTDVNLMLARGDVRHFGMADKRKLMQCIRFAVRDGGLTSRKLVDLLQAVVELNDQAVDCVDDELLDSIQGLEATLSTQGIYQQDSSQLIAMETDEDISQSEAAESEVAIKVALWPLFEHVALCAEQVCVNHLLAETVQRHEVVQDSLRDHLKSMIEYTLIHTPSCPLRILPYAPLLKNGLACIPSMSEVNEAFLDHLWRSPATYQMPLWLSCRRFLSDVGSSEEGNLETAQYGPAVLYTPLQSQCIVKLLYTSAEQQQSTKGDRDVKKFKGSKVTMDVPLGHYLEKVEQLRALSELLWSNASIMSSQKLCFRSNSVKHLLLSLSQLLKSLEPVLPERDREVWQLVVDEVVSIATTNNTDRLSLATAMAILADIITARMCGNRLSSEEVKGHSAKVTLTTIGEDVKTSLECVSDLLKTGDSERGSEQGIKDWTDRVTQDRLTSSEGGHLSNLKTLGKAWVHLGLLEVHLVAPRGPVDPAQKTALKLQYVRDETAEIENELRVRSLSSELLTGRKLEDCPISQLPERVRFSKSRLELLEERAPQLAKQTAFRPDPPQFDALLQDVKLFLTSIGSRSKVEGLINKLTSVFDSINGAHQFARPKSVRKVLNEERAWQKSLQQLLNRIRDGYPLYRDLWAGLVAAVMQMQYGMRLVAHALHSLLERRQFAEKHDSVEGLLGSVAEFPSPSCQSSQLVSSKMLKLAKGLCSYSTDDSEHTGYQKVKMSLHLLSLNHAIHEAFHSGHLDPKTLEFVLSILDTIILAWRQAEEAARRKEDEKASLYRYKAKIHGDGLTEEEREEREFRQRFPSFEKDFADITAEPTLESQPETEEQDSEINDDSDDVTTALSRDQMHRIAILHRDVFTRLVRVNWIKSGLSYSQTLSDTLQKQSRKDGYSIMVQLCGNVLPYLDPGLDSRLLGAHLLMINQLKSALTENDSSNATERPQPYDIYHDSNIKEVVLCRPLLERFRARISELLQQWPEHPTLKQLTSLIDRIMEFPITSPIMKFVTGLELLLEKAQEWESNASRAVSVREHLEKVTDLVIQWRKLELRYWSLCLDTAAYRTEQSASKWWFHIYQLIQSYLDSEDVTMATNDQDGCPSDNMEAGKDGSSQSLMSALQQFMEGSSLGEFTARLQMLYAFHCQLASQPHSPKQAELCSMLWNLHSYYEQFSPAVHAEIRNRQSPIEKELKGFVKIARWNDINFWAVKAAVEKSHKTLHKFSKKFETELKAPATLAFTDTKIAEREEISVDDSLGTSPSSFDEFLTPHEYKNYLETLPASATILVTDKSLHIRLANLLPRMTKLCLSVYRKCPYQALTAAVEGFTGEIVSGVQELQKLDITKDADKEKQKSQVRRIQQRKRKALADLFRYLATIGLSYKKGLTLARTSEQNDAMMLPPVDLAVALETDQENLGFSSSETVRLWGGCQRYFVKFIARKAAMKMALAVPAKELGIGNIERCKGFAEHLSLLAITQRRDISYITQELVETRNFLSQLQQLKSTGARDSFSPLPPQQSTASWVITAKQLLDLSRETACQYIMLLECCPVKAEGESGDVPTPLPKECLAAMDTIRQGNALWEQTREKLRECQSLLDNANQQLQPRVIQLSGDQESQLLFWSDIELIDNTFDKLDVASDIFANIEQLFSLPDTGEMSCLSTALTKTRQKLLHTALEYGHWKRWVVCVSEAGDLDQDSQDSQEMKMEEGLSQVADFVSRTESILASVLLSVQNMVKSHDHTQTRSQQPMEESLSLDKEGTEEQDPDEPDFNLQDGHLVQHLSTALGHDTKTLDLGHVSKIMRSLLGDIKRLRDACHSAKEVEELNACVELVLRLVPILHQYLGLAAFTLHQTVACHRTTCKLLSVLLGIFTELAAKGFCLPAEYSDELGGEGATEFADIEGGGIGEGEGMKDVSDQIENEEQVQDTKKPGDKQEEEDFSNQPDIKDEEQGIEMSEDFQGKLHDAEAEEVEDSADEDNDDEHEMDKQMGEVDQPGADMLDERIWGDKEDDQEQDEEKEKMKEEFGEGKGEDKQTEMVAKDDNKGAAEDQGENKNDGKDGEEEETENNENQNPNNLEPKDEGEFNDDEIDPRKANEPPEAPIPEDLDIPDDLNLDGGKMDDDEGPENQDETNPFEIETKLPEENFEDTTKEGEDQEDGNRDEGNQREDEENQLEQPEIEQGEEGTRDDNTDEDGEDGEETSEGNEEKGGIGIEPQEDDSEPIPEDSNADYQPDKAHHPQAMPEPAENYGKSKEKTDTAKEQVAPEDAGKSEEEKNKEKENVGSAESSLQEGHEGTVPSQTLPQQNRSEEKQNYKRQPGQSDAERSLGSTEEKFHKRLRTMDAGEEKMESKDAKNEDEQANDEETSDLYKHIKDALSRYDTQTMDVASDEQMMEEQAVPNQEEEEAVGMETDEEVAPLDDEGKSSKDDSTGIETLPGSKVKASERRTGDETNEPNPEVAEGEGEEDGTADKHKDLRSSNEMPASSIHTTLDLLSHDALPQQVITDEDLEVLRQEMEQQLSMLSHKQGTADEDREAQETWHRYESLTSGLARDLCEQLRLVLEPTRASKLRGDFRTGKRINMRKVIPYIASGFRKDKIWLRRTKPSKRQYQILLAVDDSSSMADNRSRQLAFESLAVVSNALTWLEAGELAVCSFGESVQLLHPFHEQFTDQSGAKILCQFTFSQRKTKIAQLLDYATITMLSARSRLQTSASHVDTSQLLLVISDGRGLFLEGMEAVKAAVRRARDANVFLVFVALDNPENKDSILDIKVPIFGGPGQLPEISTYMEHFPFPFYIILRDINSMPQTLSDALRQWFELVTAGDIH